MDLTHEDLRERLIGTIRAVGEIRAEIHRYEQQIAHLQRSIQARGGALAQAIGARELLVSVVLPEGMTLEQAWKDDFEGIRTRSTKHEQPDTDTGDDATGTDTGTDADTDADGSSGSGSPEPSEAVPCGNRQGARSAPVPDRGVAHA